MHRGDLELVTWEHEDPDGDGLFGWVGFHESEVEDAKKKIEEEFNGDLQLLLDYWGNAFRWMCCGLGAGEGVHGCDHLGDMENKPCRCDKMSQSGGKRRMGDIYEKLDIHNCQNESALREDADEQFVFVVSTSLEIRIDHYHDDVYNDYGDFGEQIMRETYERHESDCNVAIYQSRSRAQRRARELFVDYIFDVMSEEQIYEYKHYEKNISCDDNDDEIEEKLPTS